MKTAKMTCVSTALAAVLGLGFVAASAIADCPHNGNSNHKHCDGGGGPGGEPPPIGDPVLVYNKQSGKGRKATNSLTIGDQVGVEKTLVVSDGVYPSWAPAGPSFSGYRIAFNLFESGSDQGVYVIEIDAASLEVGAPVRIVQTINQNNLIQPAWNPIYEEIAYGDRPVVGLPRQLHRVSTDGTGLQQITTDQDYSVSAKSWSPDGNAIVVEMLSANSDCITDLSLGEDLQVIFPDGSAPPISLFKGTGSQFDPLATGWCSNATIQSVDWSNVPGSSVVVFNDGDDIWCIDVNDPGNPMFLWNIADEVGNAGDVSISWTGNERYLAVMDGFRAIYLLPLVPSASTALNSCPVYAGESPIKVMDGTFLRDFDWRREVVYEQ